MHFIQKIYRNFTNAEYVLLFYLLRMILFNLSLYTGVLFPEIKLSSWPTGSYSLISTVFGCPEDDDHGWHRGYINMSVPLQNAIQKWKMPRPAEVQHTADPHIMGPYSFHSLQLNFCTRLDVAVDHDNSSADGDVSSTNTSSRHDVSGGWPAGTYCILKAGLSCPEGINLKQHKHIY